MIQSDGPFSLGSIAYPHVSTFHYIHIYLFINKKLDINILLNIGVHFMNTICNLT